MGAIFYIPSRWWTFSPEGWWSLTVRGGWSQEKGEVLSGPYVYLDAGSKCDATKPQPAVHD